MCNKSHVIRSYRYTYVKLMLNVCVKLYLTIGLKIIVGTN